MLVSSQQYQPVTADTYEPEILHEEDVDESVAVHAPWRVLLYDDDIHTFDEVIQQLIKAIKCSLDKARELTLQVHNEGKATVYEGAFEECLHVDTILKEIQLVTEIKG
ncbi:MAG: ATP-dependent Clp protease adaptor ClpS [Bacteroidota bacterium]